MESIWSPGRPNIRQIRFESQRVRMVLNAFDLANQIPQMVAAFAEKWGEPRLTFETFHEFHPTFPVALDAQSFFATSGFDPWSRIATWMTRFSETFVFSRYEALATRYYDTQYASRMPEEATNLPLGMIFPWDGIRGGLIMHNERPRTFACQFVFRLLDSAGCPMRLVIERFDYWLYSIARSGWQPGAAPAKKVQIFRPLIGRGAVVRPWLVKLCGPRDAIVLAWLLRMSGRKANRWEDRAPGRRSRG